MNEARKFDPTPGPSGKDGAAHESLERAIQHHLEQEQKREQDEAFAKHVADRIAAGPKPKNAIAEKLAGLPKKREEAAAAHAAEQAEAEQARQARVAEMKSGSAKKTEELRTASRERRAAEEAARVAAMAEETREQIADMRAAGEKAPEIRLATRAKELSDLAKSEQANIKDEYAFKSGTFEELSPQRLRFEVDRLQSYIKQEFGVDMEAKTSSGLFGRMKSGFRALVSPDLRRAQAKYQAALEKLNKFMTEHEEENADDSYWSGRANRAISRPKSAGPGAGTVGRGGRPE